MLSIALLKEGGTIKALEALELNVFHVDLTVNKDSPLEIARSVLNLENINTKTLRLTYNFPISVWPPRKLTVLKIYLSKNYCKPSVFDDSRLLIGSTTYVFKTSELDFLKDLEIIAHPELQWPPIQLGFPQSCEDMILRVDTPPEVSMTVYVQEVKDFYNACKEIHLRNGAIKLYACSTASCEMFDRSRAKNFKLIPRDEKCQ